MPGGAKMMAADRLTPLQRRILRVLAVLDPPWTLTGGGALAGVHLGHRGTRDLDLFWRELNGLGRRPEEARTLLGADGLDVNVLRTSPAFAELRVTDGNEVTIIDLVAEPTPAIDAPQRVEVEGASISVDSMHEILVSKLTTLLGRTELRDLIDVRALLEAGGDLHAALRDAPSKDGGFSPLTLAWVLESFDPRPLGLSLGVAEEEVSDLQAFKRELVERLTRIAKPG